MNKQQLHSQILDALELTRNAALNAAQQAHETATHVETVAENKYDTFGLEASYLAEGQSKRLMQTETDKQRFSLLPVTVFNEGMQISFGALVLLTDNEGLQKRVFLSPVSGGLTIKFEGETVLLVTGDAPMGKALLNAYEGDEFSVGEKKYVIEGIR
jgi:transcription elongation GreA/GreB family factor